MRFGTGSVGWGRGLAILALAIAVSGCPGKQLDDDDSAVGDDDDDGIFYGGTVDTDDAVDFEYIELGEAGEFRLEIRNAGLAFLEVTAVTVAGIEEGVFSADASGNVLLPPQDPAVYMPVELTFTPPAAGPYEAWLMLFTTDVDYEPGEPYLILLQGTGVVDADGDGVWDGETYPEVGADCDDSDALVYPGPRRDRPGRRRLDAL